MEKKISTGDLLKSLFRSGNIDKYLAETELPELPPFSDYIRQLCADMGETPQHVIKRSGIERTYGHQIFNGTRNPSRDKVIQLAIGLGMDMDETQKMLRIAKKNELYPRVRRDVVLVYCITHGMGFSETQDALAHFDLQPLGE